MNRTTTSPSRYYEPRTVSKQPVVMEYRKPRYIAQDGEYVATLIGLGVSAFALGMILAAWWAGVL